MPANENSPLHRYARIAGILYLIIIIFGISSEVMIRSALIVPGNANLTAANILGAQSLFRFGFFADSVMLFADVAIAVLFYVLFKSFNNTLSLTAAAFRFAQAAVLSFNLLNYHSAILLLNGASQTAGLESGQINSLALHFLNLHAHGYDLGLLFFGISNLVLGYLILKSAYFPRLIGYGLLAAALVYLLGSYTRFLLPDSFAAIQPAYEIPLLAELAFCFWLLIKGINIQD